MYGLCGIQIPNLTDHTPDIFNIMWDLSDWCTTDWFRLTDLRSWTTQYSGCFQHLFPYNIQTIGQDWFVHSLIMEPRNSGSLWQGSVFKVKILPNNTWELSEYVMNHTWYLEGWPSCFSDFLSKIMKMFLLFRHQTSSVKHRLADTHGHNFEIHNIVYSSQKVSLTKDP